MDERHVNFIHWNVNALGWKWLEMTKKTYYVQTFSYFMFEFFNSNQIIKPIFSVRWIYYLNVWTESLGNQSATVTSMMTNNTLTYWRADKSHDWNIIFPTVQATWIFFASVKGQWPLSLCRGSESGWGISLLLLLFLLDFSFSLVFIWCCHSSEQSAYTHQSLQYFHLLS